MRNYIMTSIKLILLSILFICASCNNGYKNNDVIVSYKSWNEGSGSSERILNADPKTFKVLKHERYAKDKDFVFFDGEYIPDADAASFNSISEFYAKDKNRGYWSQFPIPSSNGKTFKTIDEDCYSTDGVDVFFDTSALHVCSAKNFRFVFNDGIEKFQCYRWTTDGCHYYYMDFKVPSEDYKSILVYPNSGGLSKDKQWAYALDKRIKYDVNGTKVIDTVDAATFNVTGLLECQDKWGCIRPYLGRENCQKK